MGLKRVSFHKLTYTGHKNGFNLLRCQWSLTQMILPRKMLIEKCLYYAGVGCWQLPQLLDFFHEPKSVVKFHVKLHQCRAVNQSLIFYQSLTHSMWLYISHLILINHLMF